MVTPARNAATTPSSRAYDRAVSLTVLDHVVTPIGVLHLRRREVMGAVGIEVTVDGAMLMSSLTTVSERALATTALARHRGDGGLAVLVGGLGLGYTAHAALADARVSAVRVVDRIPAVIGWLRDGLLPLSEELNADPRLEVTGGDVYAELLGPGAGRWDVIVVDVDHTPTERLDEASAPFYTIDGQRRVATHLAAGGVLAVWSAAADDGFAAVLDAVYPFATRERILWEETSGEEIEDIVFVAQGG